LSSDLMVMARLTPFWTLKHEVFCFIIGEK